jgi:alpha-beta hydrolase superfamily lysophospholipase
MVTTVLPAVVTSSLECTQIDCMTADGLQLTAAVRLQPEATIAIVLAHGMSGSKDDADVVAVADALHAAGYVVVTFDSRGHGGSQGQCTLGAHEDRDVAAAVAIARQYAPRVVLVGASMGAIAALRYAVSDPTLVGVVAVSSPARWKLPRTARGVLAAGITRTPFGRRAAARWLHVRLAPARIPADEPVTLAGTLAMPLAVIHGADDRFVPAAAAADLYFAAAGARRIDVVAGMGHAYDDVSIPTVIEAVAWVATRS